MDLKVLIGDWSEIVPEEYLISYSRYFQRKKNDQVS